MSTTTTRDTGATGSPHTDIPAFRYAVIRLDRRLSIVDAPRGGAGLFPPHRRTTSGLVRRIDLDQRLVCWIDPDTRDPNPAAIGVCLALTDPDPGADHDEWPWGEPPAHGTALFTGVDEANHPVGLSNAQIAALTAAHTTHTRPTTGD